MGHTWYIFIIMWFYLATPLFAYFAQHLCKKADQGKRLYLFFMAVILIVLLLGGFIYRNFAESANLNWYKHIYTAPYAKIDLFFCGLFFSFFGKYFAPKKEKLYPVLKVIAVVAVLGLVLANEAIYLLATFMPKNMELYQIKLPTAYCIVLMFYFYAFSQKPKLPNCKPTWGAVCRNPLRLIDKFSGVCFYAYLFHMSVSYKLRPYVPDERTIFVFFGFILAVTLVSSVLGLLYSKAFQFNNILQKMKTQKSLSDANCTQQLQQ